MRKRAKLETISTGSQVALIREEFHSPGSECLRWELRVFQASR